MTIRRFIPILLLPALVLAQKSPPRRAHHALVYDEASSRVLLAGGSSPMDGGQCCAFFDDLWAFDGSGWTQLPSSGGKVSGMRLAYDSGSKQVTSFGGYDGSRSLSDLRALQGDRWIALGQHPSVASAEGGFVYDIRRGRFIAFGGSAGRGQTNGDTWAFAAGAWTKIASGGPPPREFFAMTYDETRGRVIVFGGFGPSTPPTPPTPLGDLWELDGDRWSRVDFVNGPSPRHGAGVAYDSRRGRMIIFGGDDATGIRGDTWAFSDGRWTKLADASPNGPEPRAMGYLAYDKKRDRVVLFGGRKGWPNGDLSDTWEFDGVSWRRVSP